MYIETLSIQSKVVVRFTVHSLGDGAVDVGDDDLVVVPPAEHVALAARGALVGRGHAEHHLVHALAQVQLLLHEQTLVYSKTLHNFYIYITY